MNMLELDLQGTDYEIGFGHGRRCVEPARECVRFWGRVNHPDRERIDAALASAVNDLTERLPWFVERLRGISDGSGVPLHDIQTTNLCELIWNEVTGWCSVLAVRSEAGQVYLGKTSDTGTGSAAFHLFERIRPRDGLAFLRCNFAGYAGTCAGVNEAGLAYAGASVKVAPGDFRPGLPLEPLPEHVLRHCRSCEEAVTQLAPFPLRSQGGNLLFADATGRACRILKYPGVQRVEWMDGRFLAATNHHLDEAGSFGILPGDERFAANSRCRLERLCATGNDLGGDPVVALEALLHTRVAEGGVFQENDPILGTSAAYVIDPRNRTLSVAHGETTSAAFVPYTFDRPLQREGLR